jgi:hypothetical protein
MRSIAAILLFCLLALSRAAYADDDVAKKLIGTWRLVSFKVQVVGEGTDDPRDMLGPSPFGRIIITPEHTVAVYIAKEDRKGPPSNEAEAAALLSSMNAYTGRYRVEGDKFITTVDGAWNEIFKAREQVRYFALHGDELTIRTPEQPSATLPGKRVISTLHWKREM